MSETEKVHHMSYWNRLNAQVREILDLHPETRNDDTLLICEWLQQQDITTVNGIKINAQSISFESLTRARRLIQSGGDFLPTDETVIKKRKLQEVYAAAMRRLKEGS